MNLPNCYRVKKNPRQTRALQHTISNTYIFLQLFWFFLSLFQIYLNSWKRGCWKIASRARLFQQTVVETFSLFPIQFRNLMVLLIPLVVFYPLHAVMPQGSQEFSVFSTCFFTCIYLRKKKRWVAFLPTVVNMPHVCFKSSLSTIFIQNFQKHMASQIFFSPWNDHFVFTRKLVEKIKSIGIKIK